MRICTFTPYLDIYRRSPEALNRHLQQCEPCRIAVLILTDRSRLPDTPTKDCPDEATLAGFDMGIFEPGELERIGDHVYGCGHCLGLLTEAHAEEAEGADLAQVLAQAERELEENPPER